MKQAEGNSCRSKVHMYVYEYYMDFRDILLCFFFLDQITREQFLHVLLNTYGKEIKLFDMNRLYSSFDIDRKDNIDFREFAATLRILRMATEKPIEKLTGK
jgi:hypothetical protein